MQREPGFYWVKYCGEWDIARLNPNGAWSIFGCDEAVSEAEVGHEIGDRITPPEEK